MDATAELIAQAAAALGSVVHAPLTAASDASLCALVADLEQAGRLLDTARAQLAAEVEERSRFELGSAGLAYRMGHRRTVHLLENLTRVSQGEAARRIRLGAAIRPRTILTGDLMPPERPLVAAAMTAGSMGVDAAAAVIRTLNQAEKRHALVTEVHAAERALVDAAATDTADCVAVQALVWREALDPDGAELREEVIRERRGLWLGRERNGITPMRADCDPALAALLRAALSEGTAPDTSPHFLSEEDRQRGTTIDQAADGQPVERFTDPRSREQQQHDLLLGLLTAGVRSTGLEPGGMRSTARVVVVIQQDDLHSGRGVGWIDDLDEPVSSITVQQMACDAEIRHIVLGTNGEVLDLGRTERLFTTAQRIALAVRDGGCVWPDCTAPPSWCQAHHIEEWKAHAGRTDLGNGVLLCPAHHHMLHNSAFTMRVVDGRPQVLAPPWLDAAQKWKAVGGSRTVQTRQLARMRASA